MWVDRTKSVRKASVTVPALLSVAAPDLDTTAADGPARQEAGFSGAVDRPDLA